ncbi:fimbrial protein [Escherichia coli]|uniref:F4 family fimbrial subunit n=1 Tax=Escherichia coli TaxID=562 RepID=UPI00157A8F0F|nr:fimbrial protein [Escherichia coli]HBA9649675.1 fimbrial protein [Escherichia coli]
MKKTMIALALAASAVSGMAHAWTTGDFNGSFDINGTITVDQYKDKWEWMTGEGLSFEHNIKEMNNDQTKLTITQSKATPILLGRTKEAFAAPAVGVGAIPVISFTDYAGKTVTLQSSSEAAKGYFDLPMKDAEGANLGNVKVNVTVAGLVSRSNNDHRAIHQSVESKNNNEIYYGGLVSSVAALANDASSIASKFGNYNHTALLGQLEAVSDIQAQQLWGKGTANMVHTDNNVSASSYSLGIDQGQIIEATFTNPVAKTTQWSAPLNVAVTYN